MQSAKTVIGEGGTVHYWIHGDTGPSVVFTHGATMDHGMFAPQVEHFSKSCQVITWDVPAHGLSRPYTDFSLEAAAADLLAILDREGVESAHLVGQSMGGYISHIVARAAPHRVASVTALGTTPLQRSFYSALDRWLLAITPALVNLYPHDFLIRTIANRTAISPNGRRYALEVLRTMSTAEIASIMRAVYRTVRDIPQDDGPLPQRVLIAYGDADRLGKIQPYSKHWAEREGRELAVVPDAAHNANMDNPAAFNAIVESFVRASS